MDSAIRLLRLGLVPPWTRSLLQQVYRGHSVLPLEACDRLINAWRDYLYESAFPDTLTIE